MKLRKGGIETIVVVVILVAIVIGLIISSVIPIANEIENVGNKAVNTLGDVYPE